MELSLFTKVKITFTLAIGGILIGLLAWPMMTPETNYDPVALLNPEISFANIFLTALLALAAGIISGLISRPYNKQIAALAAPAGLGFLALRSGSMTDLLKANASIAAQKEIYTKLQFDGIFWFIIIIAGIIGAVISNIIAPGKPEKEKQLEKHILVPPTDNKNTVYINIIAAVVASLVVAHIVTSFFARDVIINSVNAKLVAQPEKLQIAFAVFAGFLAAGFLCKLLLRTSYIWPIIAAVLLAFIEMFSGGRTCILQAQSQNWPIGFFIKPGASILPIYYISFGSLGAIAGYWWAIRYAWWRKHNA